MTDATALITGSLSGIGLHLAHEFARHDHSLVLVAPVESELEAVAGELRAKYGASVKIIPKNLREAEATREIFDELSGAGIGIDILCNNAGFGVRGKFTEIPLEEDLEMINLNIEAVLRLTKAFLPEMLKQGHGRILNTASVGGFGPGPLLATYHATKAFVLSLSESLATELAGTAITVTAFCPGPLDTDFFSKLDRMEARASQKTNLMAPEDVAAIAYKALMAGDRLVIPGEINKTRAFPHRLAAKESKVKISGDFHPDAQPEGHRREPGEIAAGAEAKP